MAKTKPKKKKKPKKIAGAPVAKAKKEKPQSSSLIGQLARPRVLSTVAFGLSGLLAGLATGLNHFPSYAHTEVVPQLAHLASYLGHPQMDWAAGMTTALAGLAVGACLGFSALSDPKDLGVSLILSVICASACLIFTGNVALAGFGFLAGHSPAIMSYLRLRRA